MKRKILFLDKVLLAGLLCLGNLLFTGCEDMEYAKTINGTSSTRVFINTGKGYGLTNYMGSIDIMHTAIGSYGEETPLKAYVYLSGTAKSNVTVTLGYDASLVAAYNQTNGTQYKAIPGGVPFEIGQWIAPTEETEGSINLNSTVLTIPQGASRSNEQLAILIPESSYTQLTEGPYLIPVRITDVQGAELANNEGLDRMYVLVNTGTESNAAYYATSMAEAGGSSITDKSKWSIELDTDGEYDEMKLEQMIDGDNTSLFSSSGARPAVFTINLGEIRSVTGVQFFGNYAGNITPTDFDLYVSENGTDYIKIGTFGTTAINQCYVFYGATQAQFVRLDVRTWRSSQIGFSEINVYAN